MDSPISAILGLFRVMYNSAFVVQLRHELCYSAMLADI